MEQYRLIYWVMMIEARRHATLKYEQLHYEEEEGAFIVCLNSFCRLYLRPAEVYYK